MPHNVFLLEDQPVNIEGINRWLSDQNGFQITGAFTSIGSMCDALNMKVDILILDLQIINRNTLKEESSLDRLDEIFHKNPRLRVLVYTNFNMAHLVKKALDKGVAGYITKGASKAEFLLALETIRNGGDYIGEDVKRLQEDAFNKNETFRDFFSKETLLSEREKEISVFLLAGYKSKEIAKELNISPHTVHTHRKKIFKKLRIHSVEELIKLYMKRKG